MVLITNKEKKIYSSNMSLSQAKVIDTVLEFSLYDNNTCQVIFLNDLDRTSGNPFQWKNTGIVNNGTVYAGLTGYWEMMFDGAVNVKWFGVKGDGTDESTIVQSIFNLGKNVYFPSTTIGYNISNISVNHIVKIFGDNKYKTKIISTVLGVSIFITKNEFIEYSDLFFVGVGKVAGQIGIEHQFKISTIINCFFYNLKIGIFNNKDYLTDEQTIKSSRFFNCYNGIYSNGKFINSHISEFTIFHGCDSAIRALDDNSSPKTTEGLSIENCLIYDCGNRDEDIAAVDIHNLDFTFIRSCMVDLNRYISLRLSDSRFCSISDSYFSSNHSSIDSSNPNGYGASCAVLLGDCSSTLFLGCRFYDSRRWGCEINANNSIANLIAFQNCFFDYNDKISNGGDFFVNGGINISLDSCSLKSNTVTSIGILNNLGTANLKVTSTYIFGEIVKGTSSIIVQLRNCLNKITERAGVIEILDGQNTVSFPHNLTVLSGQQVIVLALNSSSFFDFLTGGIVGSNVVINRYSSSGSIVVNFRVEVTDI